MTVAGRAPTRVVRHNRIDLALWALRAGEGRPLLLVHGLGEATPESVPAWASAWTGPVWGIDLTGHGASTIPAGGGYSCEILMGDVDAALAALGPCTVLGRGLGGYVGLLIAGARPTLVRGVVIADGPGIAGGSTGAASTSVLAVDTSQPAPPDPWALAELTRDIRPPDYAASFARQAVQLSGIDEPVAVCARWRAPWVQAVIDEPGVVTSTIDEALRTYERVA